MMNSENTRTYLAYMVVAMSFLCVLGLFFIEYPDKNRDLLNVSLGTLLGLSSAVIAFYFGSTNKQKKESEDSNQQ